MKILIMGLSGSGKSTLSSMLASKLPDSIHINADIIRNQFNDWDFSIDGRFRQCNRLKFISETASTKYAICDFIAPTDDIRSMFNADFTVFVDTVTFCKYKNTNQIFQPPLTYNVRVTTQDCVYWANHISNLLLLEYVNIQNN
jgi:adenylylsulfate kinase